MNGPGSSGDAWPRRGSRCCAEGRRCRFARPGGERVLGFLFPALPKGLASASSRKLQVCTDLTRCSITNATKFPSVPAARPGNLGTNLDAEAAMLALPVATHPVRTRFGQKRKCPNNSHDLLLFLRRIHHIGPPRSWHPGRPRLPGHGHPNS